MTDRRQVAVVLLAGGEATRFPRKLEREVRGEPLLLRVYRHMRETGLPVYVSARGTFAPTIDAALECPVIVDREPRRGPLGGLLSACGAIAQPRVFAVAADQPSIDASLLECLSRAWEPGDDAVVPEHGGRTEPLAALYDRIAVLERGFDLLREGEAAMHVLIDRLRTRLVSAPHAYFTNVNRPEDVA